MKKHDYFYLTNKKIIQSSEKIKELLDKINLEKDIRLLFNNLDKNICFSDYSITNKPSSLLIIKDIESQKKHLTFILDSFENDFLDQRQRLKYNIAKRKYSFKRKSQKYLFNIDEEFNKVLFVSYYVYKADFTNIFNTEYLFYWCLIEK